MVIPCFQNGRHWPGKDSLLWAMTPAWFLYLCSCPHFQVQSCPRLWNQYFWVGKLKTYRQGKYLANSAWFLSLVDLPEALQLSFFIFWQRFSWGLGPCPPSCAWDFVPLVPGYPCHCGDFRFGPGTKSCWQTFMEWMLLVWMTDACITVICNTVN